MKRCTEHYRTVEDYLKARGWTFTDKGFWRGGPGMHIIGIGWLSALDEQITNDQDPEEGNKNVRISVTVEER